jgi:signal peptidase II
MIWLFWYKQATDRWLTMSMGLISAGILGNLYDRLGFGYRIEYPLETKYNVRDFIHFRLDGVRFLDPWPNFNIADSMLVCGAIMLILHAFFGAVSGSNVGTTAESDNQEIGSVSGE